MTTVKEVFESIKIEDLRLAQEQENKNKDAFFTVNLSDDQLISTEFYMIIWNKIQKVSKRIETKDTRKGLVLNSSYYFEIQNEKLLNTLRSLYFNTKNNFVKSVIKTVGQNKRMTEKQSEIIIEELMKFNLTINF